MKKIIMLLMLVFLTLPTKIGAQTIENNDSNTDAIKNEACYTMRVYNDTSDISEVLASVELKDEELASKIQLTVKDSDGVIYEGSLSEFKEQRLAELLLDDSKEFNYCLTTEEDIDLDAVQTSLDWQVELETIASSASLEPEVEEVDQECVSPYPSVNHLSMLPMSVSKTGIAFALASFAAGFFIARKKR